MTKDEAVDLTASGKKHSGALSQAKCPQQLAAMQHNGAKAAEGNSKTQDFRQMVAGIAAMKSHRERKLTLRTCKVETYKVELARGVEGRLEIGQRYSRALKLLPRRLCRN